MNKFNLFFGAIAIIALVIGIIAISSDGKLGAITRFSGPVDSEEGFSVDEVEIIGGTGNLTIAGESNLDTLVQGGDVTTIISTSTTLRETLTAAQICDSAIIKISLLAGGIDNAADTWNLPTSTDLIADCLPAIGDTKRVLFQNYSTSTYAITWSQRAIASTFIDFMSYTTSTDYSAAATGLSNGVSQLHIFQNLDGVSTSDTILPIAHQ